MKGNGTGHFLLSLKRKWAKKLFAASMPMRVVGAATTIVPVAGDVVDEVPI